jgi:hypothetical protein
MDRDTKKNAKEKQQRCVDELIAVEDFLFQ